MQVFIRIVGTINLWVGKAAAYLSLVITAAVLLEVIARYFLKAPTSWSNEVSQYLLCAMVMFGGGYTLRKYGHTRVDVLFVRFSKKRQALVEILTGLCVLLVAGPIVWFGGLLSIEAFQAGQTSVSAAQLPLWPSMATVPLGAAFLGLQGLANAFEAAGIVTGASTEKTAETL